jgi:hypothetical protein
MKKDAIRDYYDRLFNRLTAGVTPAEPELTNADLTAEEPTVEEILSEDAEPTFVVDPEAEIEGAAETNDPIVVSVNKRLGIHYFPDENHYSNADLQLWLPVLKSIGVNWITLPAPEDRAIPQPFIDALVDSDIQPVVAFNLTLSEAHPVEDYSPIFKAYANWGVRYVVLFDRPNVRSQWPATGWTQKGLVDRFLDQFVPLAHAAIEAGLNPVFPALEPGGDYWDTAFLRGALETLGTRGETMLLEKLVIGAYAWTEDRSMTYGAGGPEAWPATMPYHTPDNSEDQRGFRIFDWYNAISRAVLGKELPIIIVAAGVQRESGKPLDAFAGVRATKMAETLMREPDPNKNNAVPENVLACNFWVLSALPDSPEVHSAWFKHHNAKPNKAADEWILWRNGGEVKKSAPISVDNENAPVARKSYVATNGAHAIRHYLLLPAGGEWPMDAVRAFMEANQATIGTSEEEATQAGRVTLAGGLHSFSDDLLRQLIQSGCTVDHLQLA